MSDPRPEPSDADTLPQPPQPLQQAPKSDSSPFPRPGLDAIPASAAPPSAPRGNRRDG